MTKLTLPYPPSANVYWRHNRGRIHRSQEAQQYIYDVGMLCLAAGIVPLQGHICLSVDIYRPARRGDLDNTLKVMIDALRDFAYIDDSQITEIHAMRHDDKLDPRAEIVITEIP